MGAGKTTVGMELAKKLNYKLIDTDHSIENDQSREFLSRVDSLLLHRTLHCRQFHVHPGK